MTLKIQCFSYWTIYDYAFVNAGVILLFGACQISMMCTLVSLLLLVSSLSELYCQLFWMQ